MTRACDGDSAEGDGKGADVDALTYAAIGAAQKVHAVLGPGFTEAVYQRALAKELMLREIPFQSQPEYEVFYEGALCGTYRPDMVVAGTVIVELKAVAAPAKEHVAQAVSYLKASGHPVALLLNFGAPSLEVRRLDRSRLKPRPPRRSSCSRPGANPYPHNPDNPHNPFLPSANTEQPS